MLRADGDRRAVIVVDRHRDLAVSALRLVPRRREAATIGVSAQNFGKLPISLRALRKRPAAHWVDQIPRNLYPPLYVSRSRQFTRGSPRTPRLVRPSDQ